MSGAFATIQEALDAAADGGEVTLCAGTYSESLEIGRPVTLRGVDGAAVTTIEADGVGVVIAIDDADAVVLSGLTLTNGYGESAGALGITRADVTVTECTITENDSEEGTILAEDSTLVLTDSVVSANESRYASGLYATDTTVEIERVLFGNNENEDGSYLIVIESGALDLWNSALYDNAVNTLIASTADSTRVVNSIFAVPSTGISSTADGHIEVQNSVFYRWAGWPSSSTGMTSSGTIDVQYSMFDDLDEDYYVGGAWHEADSGDGNLHDQPEFVAPGSDFTLGTFSPCMDAGNPAAAYNDTDGSRNDMGVFGGPEGSGW